MKRIILAILAGLIITLTFTACGSSIADGINDYLDSEEFEEDRQDAVDDINSLLEGLN